MSHFLSRKLSVKRLPSPPSPVRAPRFWLRRGVQREVGRSRSANFGNVLLLLRPKEHVHIAYGEI